MLKTFFFLKNHRKVRISISKSKSKNRLEGNLLACFTSTHYIHKYQNQNLTVKIIFFLHCHRKVGIPTSKSKNKNNLEGNSVVKKLLFSSFQHSVYAKIKTKITLKATWRCKTLLFLQNHRRVLLRTTKSKNKNNHENNLVA